jgi:hypothetical protein
MPCTRRNTSPSRSRPAAASGWLPPRPSLSEQLETAIKEGKLVEVLADNTQLLPQGNQMTPLPSEPDLTLPIIDLTPIQTVPTEHQLSIN